MADLLVAIVGRKFGEIAIGGICSAGGPPAALIANPFALDINVLDGNGLAGSPVGSDRLELAHRFGISLAVRGIQGEAPASTLALGSVAQLAESKIGVQPFRVMLC